MIIEAVGVGIMAALGWFVKHRTTIDHKKTGVLQNAALAAITAGAAAAANGDPSIGDAVTKGAALFATVEAGLNAAKAAKRLLTGKETGP